MTAVLNALSVGVHEAAQGSGVEDTELCKVLPNRDIVPGKLSDKATIDATQARAELGKHKKIGEFGHKHATPYHLEPRLNIWSCTETRLTSKFMPCIEILIAIASYVRVELKISQQTSCRPTVQIGYHT